MSFIDSLLKPLVGRRPSVPTLSLPDISGAQVNAAKGNLDVLPLSEKAGSEVDKFNLSELSKALEFLLPGGLGKLQSNINSQLSGEVDPSDTSAVIRNATASGYGKGFNFGQGGIGRNLVARDLGLSVSGIKERGASNAFNLFRMAPPRYDPTSMFFTSSQRLNAETQQAEEQFNRNWLSEQVAAAPSPLGQFIQNVVYAVAGTAGRYFGVAGGGGKPANSSSAGPAGSGDFYIGSGNFSGIGSTQGAGQGTGE